MEQTGVVVRRSSALRRAQLVHRVLKSARVLWVDDHPENNAYECSILEALGISVTQVTSTKGALARAKAGKYDVILSDIKRTHSNSGLQMLRRLQAAGCTADVIFYVGCVDQRCQTPLGAFGITDQPESLLHYVFDVLERKRV
jgi:CheY-like chemotaxis protein